MFPDLLFLARTLIFPGLLFLSCLVLFCDWFERKLAAKMQNRMGPSYTGPWGILQPLADYMKLFSKEDVVPIQANRIFFTLAPVLSLSLFAFALFFLPLDGAYVLSDSAFEGDLILVLVLVTLATFTMFLSGWASANPYSGIGATRVLTQLLGYDIPLIALAACPAFVARSLCIWKISASQNVPYALVIPWAFLLFIIVLQAELEKDPFDIPHAETELVAGYETEFSGRRLAFLRLARDFQLLFGAALTTSLFLGGPEGPVIFGPASLWRTVWFIAKMLLVLVVFEYVAAICARLRIDQLMRANWMRLVQLSVLSLAATVAFTPILQLIVGGV